jgi:predicted dehydrogenase
MDFLRYSLYKKIKMKRYAFVGASSRGLTMYAIPLSKDFNDVAEIVGAFDTNIKRCEVMRRKTNLDFPVFNDFDLMLKETKPEVVIVTTVDCYHHEYIIRSLEAGCDVISEKPMTTDEDKCNAIMEAEARTGKKVIVTFNVRFMPFSTRLKQLMMEGTVGKVLNLHFEWMLDTSHGADYFRRWHRRKENSGGLLIHKSTHHFDLVNWLIDDEPVTINAFGATRYYGPTRDERGERCLNCKYKNQCEFYIDITSDDFMRGYYLECEDVDGYYRDKCVFSEEIDAEDTASVSVLYSKGAMMSYSLTAHSPYEGYRLSINGTDGRMEVEDFHGSIGPFAGKHVQNIRIYNRDGEEISIKVPTAGGAHGGGDKRLLEMIIRGNMEDPYGHLAGSRAGAMSIIIGIAANKSIKEGKSFKVSDLLI